MERNRPRPSQIEEFYQDYLLDQDTASFALRVAKRYWVSTLERLASSGLPHGRRGAVLALGHLANYESNSVLGRALCDSDPGVRMLAETALLSVWRRSGTEAQQRQLERIINLITVGQHEEACKKATDLVEHAPWFAEAWYQRATARFHQKRFRESVRDCHQTLEINPYHFGAASSMGHCYLQLNELILSLESFRRALSINPNLESVRAQITRLERSVERGR